VATLKMGINNVSNADYHADRSFLSSSVLKTLYKSPSQYHREYILGLKDEQKDDGRFVEGSATHSLILEPHVFDSEFVIYDGAMKRGAAWEAFKAQNLGRQILSRPQHEKVLKLVEACKAHNYAASLFTDSFSEHTLCVEMDGVNIKVRADALRLNAGQVVDIKTTSSESGVEHFKFTIDQFGYGLSGALYAKAFEIYYGKPFEFLFVVLSKRDFGVEVFRLSDESRTKGLQMIDVAIANYKRGISTGDWSDNAIITVDSEGANIASDTYEVLEV